MSSATIIHQTQSDITNSIRIILLKNVPIPVLIWELNKLNNFGYLFILALSLPTLHKKTIMANLDINLQ